MLSTVYAVYLSPTRLQGGLEVGVSLSTVKEVRGGKAGEEDLEMKELGMGDKRVWLKGAVTAVRTAVREKDLSDSLLIAIMSEERALQTSCFSHID